MKLKQNTHSTAEVITVLSGYLKSRGDIIFALLHGSFIREKTFRDIDIAIFLDPIPDSPLNYELDLSTKLDMATSLPAETDIRILNGAPLSFRFHCIRDYKILLCRDEARFVEFREHTIRDYQDNSYHYNTFLKQHYERQTQQK